MISCCKAVFRSWMKMLEVEVGVALRSCRLLAASFLNCFLITLLVVTLLLLESAKGKT